MWLPTVLILLSTALPLPARAGHADHYTPNREYTGQTIWDFPQVPEAEVDIGLWGLVVAREYDSTIDVRANLHILDTMAAEIRRMLAGRTKDMDKFLAVRMFMFESGVWNDHNPFTYDLDDPLGTRTENKLLSTYLETRTGNCISMPTLMLALMERIDPDVQLYGATAPSHVFCRYTDRQTRDAFNVEATSGGNPSRNEWVIEQTGISQRAIDRGTYLRDLTKKEFVAVLIESLVIKHRNAGNYHKAIRYADLMLTIAPDLISSTLMKMGSEIRLHDVYAYQNIDWKNGQGPCLTPTQHAEWHRLHISVETALKKLHEMGWVEQTEEQEQEYLKSIEAERRKRSTQQHIRRFP